MNYYDHLSDTESLTDNVNIAIKRYENHPGIARISRLTSRKNIFISIKWRIKKLQNKGFLRPC